MSPEIALVAIIAFLWGPTIVWLVFRAARGRPHRSDDFSSGSASETTEAWARPGAAALTDLVDRAAYWACKGCRSLNPPKRVRCYSCGSPRPDLGQPDEPPAVPPLDAAPAGGALAAGRVEPGTSANGVPPAVCPFLQVAGDPATSSPGPSLANRCTAGLAPTGSWRRMASARPVKIALDTQQALCFGPWYGACGRHRAARTGRPPVTSEPEVALMIAALRAAAETELPTEPVASGGGASPASPARPRAARTRHPSTSTRGRTGTVPPPPPPPEEPGATPAPRRSRRQR